METHQERALISCCYKDATCIDRAIQHGITDAHFLEMTNKAQWAVIKSLHMKGAPVAVDSVFTQAQTDGLLTQCGGIATIIETDNYAQTTFAFQSVLEAMHNTFMRGELIRRMEKAKEMLAGDGPLKDVAVLVEQMGECLTSGKAPHRSTKEVSDVVIEQAMAQVNGVQSNLVEVHTGLRSFDRFATPILPHEYVVIGGRTSHGKSSLMCQIAGHNVIDRNLKVAYYTIETSSEAVLRQLAAQASGTNSRFLAKEPVDAQKKYIDTLRFLGKSSRLMIFDNILNIDDIAAHGRMMASSFKPDLVLIDYLNIIGVKDSSQYEQMTKISKAMIPLRKALNCALITGAQFNRGPEKDERRPQRTDFRDSGSIEEDAHRLIAVWRKPNQALDQNYFDCEILQLKLRDGPLAGINAKFSSSTTKFFEQATQQQ